MQKPKVVLDDLELLSLIELIENHLNSKQPCSFEEKMHYRRIKRKLNDMLDNLSK